MLIIPVTFNIANKFTLRRTLIGFLVSESHFSFCQVFLKWDWLLFDFHLNFLFLKFKFQWDFFSIIHKCFLNSENKSWIFSKLILRLNRLKFRISVAYKGIQLKIYVECGFAVIWNHYFLGIASLFWISWWAFQLRKWTNEESS